MIDSEQNKFDHSRIKILIADDEPSIRDVLSQALGVHEGYHVETAADGTEAIEKIHQEYYDIVYVDLRMPGADGIEVIRELKRQSPVSEAVIITAFGTIPIAVEALRAGAWDFVTKPFHIEEVKVLTRKIIEMRILQQENIQLRRQIQDVYGFPNIVGNSTGMQKVFQLIRSVADTDATILIMGESGTGKELIAKAIHYRSSRSNKPLIIVNCAAIPEELLESELFGHVKGAFTGAIENRVGRFEVAHGGTIFLDEIGEMSPRLQAKILRILEEREFEPVGSTKSKKVDVRIMSATNKDLLKAIDRGEFRQDLYYRLNVVPIYLPPIRERREDIGQLIHHFVTKYNKKMGFSVKGFTPAAVDFLQRFPWPGNVREIENLVEQMVVVHQNGIIDIEQLPERYRSFEGEPQFNIDSLWIGDKTDLGQVLNTLERELINRALKQANGVKSKAAELLRLKRTTLIEKMKKFNIDMDKD